ncbi:ABC transporter substrate-binding protein [Kineococcus sp. G2]|uniref:ABC transporter substrate-binding protein n=1 Tax=Kineococcus sp. G2 TaxID=3127484 RepID=UPI00301DE062
MNRTSTSPSARTLTRRTTLAGLVALTGGALAACGGGGDDGADVSDKTTGAMKDFDAGTAFKATAPLTYTSLFSDQPTYPFKEDWLFWTALQENTDVGLDFTIVPASDYEQKRSLVVSAGDSPIIIPKTYPGQETPFVASGVVLPVSDYTDLMPHFRDQVEKWDLQSEVDTLRQKDGKYYVLPGLHEALWPDYTLIVRTDVFEKAGVPLPTSWAEVESALAAIKQANPDSIPFSDRYEGKSVLNYGAVAFGTVGGWGYGEGLQFDEDNDEFVFAAATDEYRSMVEYFAGLVSKGLMDPESFTQTDDAAQAKFTSGRSFVISGNSQDPSVYRAQMDQSIGAGNYAISKIIVPSGPAGDLIGGSRLENGIMISAKAAERDDFQALMQFIDWLFYSDEGREFAKWGVEGTTYTKDASGKRSLMPDINYTGLNPAGTKDLRIDYGFSQGNFSYGGSTELLHSMMSEEELAFQEAMTAKTPVEPLPAHPYSQVEQEQITLLAKPLQDFVDQSTLQFITGQRSLADWDAYVGELEQRGSTRYLELVNKAYAEAKA